MAFQPKNIAEVTLGGNTAGVMAAISSGSMTLAGGNNVTLSQNGNAVTISGPSTVAAGTQSLSAGANSVTGTGVSLAIAAGNNITLGTATAAGALTVSITGVAASANVASAVGISGGNTSNASGSSTGSIYLQGGNNVTLSGTGSTIVISVPTPAASGTVVSGLGISGGNTSNISGSSTGSIYLQGGNNITLSGTGSTIVISAGANAVGTQSLSAGANSVTGTAVSLALFAGNNVNLSTATAAGALSVTVANQTGGSLASQRFYEFQCWPTTSVSMAEGLFQTAWGYERFTLPAPMTVTEVDLGMASYLFSTSNAAGTVTASLTLQVMSFNATGASTVGSLAFSTVQSASSITASSTNVNVLVTFPASPSWTLAAGEYLFACIGTTSTAGANPSGVDGALVPWGISGASRAAMGAAAITSNYFNRGLIHTSNGSTSFALSNCVATVAGPNSVGRATWFALVGTQ